MISAAFLAAMLCAPQVRLAPDQPLPYAFSDEPVIVEFQGDEPLSFDVMLVYGTGQFPSNSHGLGPITLRPGHPYWASTNLEPVRFGVHAITMNLQWPTGSETHEFTLQRIRRPDVQNPPRMLMRIPNRPGPWATIVRVAPAARVSIPSNHPDLEPLLEIFAREEIPVRLLLRQDHLALPAPLAPESLAVSASQAPDQWIRHVRRLRDQFPKTRIVLENPSPGFLRTLLQMGGVQLFNEISTQTIDALGANRAAAERQGYENLVFSVYTASASDMLACARAWNAGARTAEISLDPLWYDEALTPEFGMLNAAVHLTDQSRVGGRYSDGPVQTVVLRNVAADGSGWLAPVSQTAGLAAAEHYADEHGNPHDAPPQDVAFAVGGQADVVLAAVAYEVRQEAAALREFETVMTALSEEFGRAIDRLAECTGAESMRAEFFSLLRALPAIEEAWHTGDVRKSDAAPALALAERLARRLAALEQTLDAPFVEPLDETLERCAEQQALYLTATLAPGASAERGERLMMHVSELIVEARSLHRQGRLIEADAIAALAEWRARSLVHTTRARPLTEVEPEPVAGQ